jgi:hypothetical protein
MTTEELAAAGLPAEPVAQNLGDVQPPEEQASPAASESKSHKMGESEQTMKMSGMWTPTSEIWSEQGQRDLFLYFSFSGNLRLPLT